MRQGCVQGGADAVPVRLRNALARILSRSLMTMRPFYLPLQPSATQLGQPPGGAQQGVGVPTARTGSGTEPTALINAGNMYGLQVRPTYASAEVQIPRMSLVSPFPPSSSPPTCALPPMQQPLCDPRVQGMWTHALE